ncbi:hypothetical protein [uncultured Tenacibaculum sp.]|uniref:hypothetical protein n=1 Tax=uncultured Tenacibaculum sp. TaxID=174713 RepID=UPI00263510F9|nr:hypothetical protein [uncultured Tenacibaculum sp.]
MRKIKEELQEYQDEQFEGVVLRTNEEIIDVLIENGDCFHEFHTSDVNRLIVENNRMKSLINLFEASKTHHELPNDNTAEYNEGYVKCCNNIINRISEIV